MSLSLNETLSKLTPEWSESLLPAIRQELRRSKRVIVVLDDDPTGTQTVYDTPVLTHWSVKALRDELSREGHLFYVLTNSRSLTADKANDLAREIGKNLVEASQEAKRDFVVVSRSDSTLRGHYPGELNALAAAINEPDAVYIITPFFWEGGRLTIDDVHYVAEGETLVPAAETSFAKDATFGYRSSNLKHWVAEKHASAVDPAHVHSIGLTDLRQGGPDSVADKLVQLPAGSQCVVNAVSMRDMEVFVLGSIRAEAAGQTMLYRTAASFVQARAGLEPRPLLTRDEIIDATAKAGLIVVGSYVPQTTKQLEVLRHHHAKSLRAIELDVNELLSDRRESTIDTAAQTINRHLSANHDVVLYTGRTLITGPDATSSLRIGTQVSEALVRIVRSIQVPLRFLIAKGGITSSDVATQGLGVKRAIVAGQILPGIPVWRLQHESRYPGLGYVVFPGNVGDQQALLAAFEKLK